MMLQVNGFFVQHERIWEISRDVIRLVLINFVGCWTSQRASGLRAEVCVLGNGW